MKLITGFFMAWGNFLTLPCPLKLWDNDLKNYMLGFLPSVGFIIGLLWAAAFYLMAYLSVPYLVMAFLMTFIPFILCGFMHLDGFMDCSDAIMSRKPIEIRQQILKDSHCGAFSVVALVFFLLAFNAFITSAVASGLDFINLMLIPVFSRGISAIHVLKCKPIGHSQYAAGAGSENTAQKSKAVTLVIIQLLVYAVAVGLFAISYVETAIVLLAVILGGIIAIAYGRKQLGGMSGDIAGYGIVWAELVGVLTLALL